MPSLVEKRVEWHSHLSLKFRTSPVPHPARTKKTKNVFVHFEPFGHTLLHHEERANDDDSRHDDDEESLEELYMRAWKRLKSKCVDDDECRARVDLNVVSSTRVPHYISPGSEEERRWLQTHPKARFVSLTVRVL